MIDRIEQRLYQCARAAVGEGRPAGRQEAQAARRAARQSGQFIVLDPHRLCVVRGRDFELTAADVVRYCDAMGRAKDRRDRPRMGG